MKMMKGLSRADVFNNTAPVSVSYDWDFEIINTPKCMRGLKLNTELFGDNPSAKGMFRAHTDTMQVPNEMVAPQTLTTMIRGFRKSQVGGDIPDYSSFGFNVQDFEDSRLQIYFTALAYKSCDPNTKAIASGYGPLDFFFDFNLYQLDTQWRPIKMWKLRDCIINQFTTGATNFDSTKSPHGLSQVFGTTDHYEIYFNNDRNAETPVWVRADGVSQY